MLLALLVLPLAQTPCAHVDLDVTQWVKELNAAPPAQHNELLARMRLPPVTGAKSVVAQVIGGRGTDSIVVADFALIDEPLHEERVQVLRRVSRGHFCALGSEISTELIVSSHSPCPAGDGEPDTFVSMRFRFTPLTDAAHDSVEVISQIDQQSCRGIRGRRSTHSFWDASDNGLRAVLTLYESDYRSVDQNVREWFVLSDRVPRFADQFTETCLTGEDGGVACTTTKTRFAIGYVQDPAPGTDAGVGEAR